MSLRHYPVFNGAVMAQTGCAVIELRLKEKPMAFLLRHWIFLMAAQRRNGALFPLRESLRKERLS